jgi:hypothetical protein
MKTKKVVPAEKKSSKHTPGPWETVYNDARIIVHSTGDRSYRFVAITNNKLDTGRDTESMETAEDIANACLISAAPDLLKVCKHALRVIVAATGDDAPWEPVTSELRDVIVKAEGSV